MKKKTRSTKLSRFLDMHGACDSGRRYASRFSRLEDAWDSAMRRIRRAARRDQWTPHLGWCGWFVNCLDQDTGRTGRIGDGRLWFDVMSSGNAKPAEVKAIRARVLKLWRRVRV